MTLQREPSAGDCTHGVLTAAEWTGQTLEDVIRPEGVKVYGATAIPAGRYPVRITRSTRFGRMLPEICDVPGFSGVRIHPGNTARDTEGCVLVGIERGPGCVVRSREAMEGLMRILAQTQAAGIRSWITILNP
jgi:hypothetical protein